MLYQGNCVNQASNGRLFACVCPPNFTGATCETSQITPTITSCNPNPCSAGGTCNYNSAYNTFSCNCPPGYTGDRCTLIMAKQANNACLNNPCLSGGVCSVSPGSSLGYTCRCATGFIGFRCEQADLCGNKKNEHENEKLNL